MACELRVKVVGDADRGQALLDLICDETGVGYQPIARGGRFYFNVPDRADAEARVESVLDPRADDWRDYLSF
jgi:hypothetical protein